MIHVSPRELLKPEIPEIHSVLAKYNGLIVHFSGAPKGSGADRDNPFPKDLQHVINGCAQGGISCSIVMPGDNFYGIDRNATGCVGVVIDLQTSKSLVAVDSSDCGSIENDEGVRIVACECDITSTEVDESITRRKRTSYNEWVVRNFNVIGIFATQPYEVSKRQIPDFPPEMPDYLRSTGSETGIGSVSIEQICRTFPDKPIFGFQGSEITKLSGNQWIGIQHNEIYRTS